jgi:glutamine amidotransferase
LSAPRVTIVDYEMGNRRSLQRALERSGATVEISGDPDVVRRADRVAIPGQGAFGQAVDHLVERGLFSALQEVCADGRPVLGVCLGQQLLFATSEEAPGRTGLAIVDDAVTLLPVGNGLKRPHMGWAPVHTTSKHPVLAANPSGEAFYFVHSYAARRADGFDTATTEHGVTFVAALTAGNVVGTQFHPEKSQDAGQRLLTAWLSL